MLSYMNMIMGLNDRYVLEGNEYIQSSCYMTWLMRNKIEKKHETSVTYKHTYYYYLCINMLNTQNISIRQNKVLIDISMDIYFFTSICFIVLYL